MANYDKYEHSGFDLGFDTSKTYDIVICGNKTNNLILQKNHTNDIVVFGRYVVIREENAVSCEMIPVFYISDTKKVVREKEVLPQLSVQANLCNGAGELNLEKPINGHANQMILVKADISPAIAVISDYGVEVGVSLNKQHKVVSVYEVDCPARVVLMLSPSSIKQIAETGNEVDTSVCVSISDVKEVNSHICLSGEVSVNEAMRKFIRFNSALSLPDEENVLSALVRYNRLRDFNGTLLSEMEADTIYDLSYVTIE